MSTDGTTITVDYAAFNNNLTALKARFATGILIITKTMATKMEGWAKDNAKWQDRTGNARQTLSGKGYMEGASMVVAELSHGVDYGIWLELANQGKYAILEDALEANKNEIMEAWAKVIK